MKQTYTAITAYIAVLFLLPFATFAQEYFGEVDTFFINIGGFIDNILIPLLFTLALLVFLFGMFKYFILGGGNESEREKGKQLIMYSLIGFVLMVSIWGIVNIIAGGLFGTATPPTIPGTPTL